MIRPHNLEDEIVIIGESLIQYGLKTLKVVTKGESIKVYLDGKLVIDTADNAFKEGYAGLNVWHSTTVFNQIKYNSKK